MFGTAKLISSLEFKKGKKWQFLKRFISVKFYLHYDVNVKNIGYWLNINVIGEEITPRED
jgi:hypothetical protein